MQLGWHRLVPLPGTNRPRSPKGKRNPFDCPTCDSMQKTHPSHNWHLIWLNLTYGLVMKKMCWKKSTVKSICIVFVLSPNNAPHDMTVPSLGWKCVRSDPGKKSDLCDVLWCQPGDNMTTYGYRLWQHNDSRNSDMLVNKMGDLVKHGQITCLAFFPHAANMRSQLAHIRILITRPKMRREP